MSWGEQYIEDKAVFTSGRSEVGSSCDNAVITIIKVKDQLQLCTRGNTIELFIDNGPEQLEGIKARVLGTDSVYVAENILQQPLSAGGSLKTSIPHEPVGALLQVKLTPVVSTNGERQFCTQSETLVEDIPPC